MHADAQHKSFQQPAGDHFTLLNIWEKWEETNFDISWTYQNFIQIKSLNRARDIRDQLAQLCERVEIMAESNTDPNDIIPIQKALLAGYFVNTVRAFALKVPAAHAVCSYV
jgi:pre-mRNA-splicing factor ATP-dependent RNA helicase DHX16